MNKRYEVESEEGWRNIADIARETSLKFPPNWEIAILPPFAGAMMRFIASIGTETVSVYADFNDALGIVGEPYWEAYPIQGNTERFLFIETTQLIDAMSDEFERRFKLSPTENKNA